MQSKSLYKFTPFYQWMSSNQFRLGRYFSFFVGSDPTRQYLSVCVYGFWSLSIWPRQIACYSNLNQEHSKKPYATMGWNYFWKCIFIFEH